MLYNVYMQLRISGYLREELPAGYNLAWKLEQELGSGKPISVRLRGDACTVTIDNVRHHEQDRVRSIIENAGIDITEDSSQRNGNSVQQSRYPRT
jgi:hypothetical protein